MTLTVPHLKYNPITKEKTEHTQFLERARMRANPICFLFTLTLLMLLGLARPTSTAPDLSPASLTLPAPPPTAGGDFSSSPSRGWGGWVSSSPSSHSPAPETSPLVPREGSPSALSPAGAPDSGDGVPFLSSNPAVPLPTGMTDTASFRPLPTSGDGTKAVGLGSPTVAVERGWWLPSAMMCCFALGMWM